MAAASGRRRRRSSPSPGPPRPTPFSPLRGIESGPTRRQIGVTRRDVRAGDPRPHARPQDPRARQPPGRVREAHLGISRTAPSRTRGVRKRTGDAAATRRHAPGDRPARYGVEAHVVVAIWGMETKLRRLHGRPQRRARRGHARLRQQPPPVVLDAAVRRRHQDRPGRARPPRRDALLPGAPPWATRSSSPTSWKAYAADYDGDGRRDNLALHPRRPRLHGQLPEGARLAHRRDVGPTRSSSRRTSTTRVPTRGASATLAEWTRLGIRRANGQAFPRPDKTRPTSSIPPARRGPAFLMLAQLPTSSSATTTPTPMPSPSAISPTGSSAAARSRQAWPRDARPLSRAQARELQSLLTRAGFGTGGVDGADRPEDPRPPSAPTSAPAVPCRTVFASTELLDELRRR